MRSGDIEGAEAELSSYVERYPSDPEGWLELGKTRILLDRPDAARKALAQAARVDPDLWQADYLVGLSYLYGGQYRQAVHVLEEVASELERLRISTDKVGIILKTDTLGSLEALIESLRARDVPIRLADIGDISRREVMEALSVKYDEPLYGAILAFNVKPVMPQAVILPVQKS